MGVLMTTVVACSDSPLAPEIVESDSRTIEGSTSAAPAGTQSSWSNPMQGARLYVEPSSNAAMQAAAWRSTRPADAAQMDKIAAQPQAIWFGDWNPEPYQWVREVTQRIRSSGALPVYVLYNIPHRDCGLYSSGGASDAAAYARWISEVARGIGSGSAVVVLEPDAVAGMDCLPGDKQAERLKMISDAVATLKKSGSVSVYIDAGNARWHSAEVIGGRLAQAGVGNADGFALNVSNFLATEESMQYGDAVSRYVDGKHYVIDTSRNGAGPAPNLDWCNPSGRALGSRPTTQTGHALADAFLWIKSPGESDGACNGGPDAGVWWADYALELARRAAWG